MFEPTIAMTNDEIVKHMSDVFILENFTTCLSSMKITCLPKIDASPLSNFHPYISNLYETYIEKHPETYLNPLVLEGYCQSLRIEDKVKLTEIIMDDLHFRITNKLNKSPKYVKGNKTIN